LTEGELIVVHCLAGLGRTGTLAARVLVEAGAPPERAVESVRRARPGTIQTERQERHVLSLAGAAAGRRQL
jgi:ADP-ribosyl-[dinitrogen reductase] hydrolase